MTPREEFLKRLRDQDARLHVITYFDNAMYPPSVRATCACGWGTGWNSSYLNVRSIAQAHRDDALLEQKAINEQRQGIEDYYREGEFEGDREAAFYEEDVE
jgi:hypothetical protein